MSSFAPSSYIPFTLHLSLSTCPPKSSGAVSDVVLYFGSKEVRLLQQVKPSDLPMDAGEDDPPQEDIPPDADSKDASLSKKFVPPVTGITPASFYGTAKKAGPLFVSSPFSVCHTH